MMLRVGLLALLWTLADCLVRHEDEEAAHFNIRPGPLAPLPGMIRRTHHHNGPPGPPGISPPAAMIRAMRKEHLSSLAITSLRRHPHLLGFSRRRVHRNKNKQRN